MLNKIVVAYVLDEHTKYRCVINPFDPIIESTYNKHTKQCIVHTTHCVVHRLV